MDQPTKPVTSTSSAQDWRYWPERHRLEVGGLKVQRLVRAVSVVMHEVLAHDRFEVSTAEDKDPVQAFPTQSSNPALGVGICPWRPRGGPDGPDALRCEDLVERPREVGVTVPEAAGRQHLARGHGEVASGLGHPGAGGVGRHPAEMDTSGVDFDEEQHVDAAEEYGVLGESPRQDGLGLGADELRPRGAEPATGRIQPMSGQHPADRGGRDPDAETGEFPWMRT